MLYLAAPALVHLLGFVQWQYAVPVLVLLAAALPALAPTPILARPGMRVALSMAFASGLLLLIGMPGGPYPWDWIKHWALINALADRPWPVEIPLRGEPLYLRFYVGAYLVPALLAKATGLPVAGYTAAWLGLGFTLLFRSMLLVRPEWSVEKHTLLLAAILLLAGADAWVGAVLRAQWGLPFVGFYGIHHEWWSMYATDLPLQYSSTLALLVWVPHQAVATGLAVMILLVDRGPFGLARATLATGLLAIWSPYGLIGLLPLVIARAFLQRCHLNAHNLRVLAVATLAATAFAGLVAASLHQDLPNYKTCMECAPLRLLEPERFALFWLVELCVPVILLRNRLWKDPLCLLSFVVLLILPMAIGSVPDPVMRISMPLLFVLMVRSAENLVDARTPSARAVAMFALVIASPTTVGEATYHLGHGQVHRALRTDDPLSAPWYSAVATTERVGVEDFVALCGSHWLPQYFATSRPPTFRPPGP